MYLIYTDTAGPLIRIWVLGTCRSVINPAITVLHTSMSDVQNLPKDDSKQIQFNVIRNENDIDTISDQRMSVIKYTLNV